MGEDTVAPDTVRGSSAAEVLGREAQGREEQAGVALRREGWGLRKDTRRGMEKFPEGGEANCRWGERKCGELKGTRGELAG